MKILVFVEGTLLMHSGAKDWNREDIVTQVKVGLDPSIYKWSEYVPIGHAVEKLDSWRRQGAEILYLTARIKLSEVEEIRSVLKKYGFPKGHLLSRQKGEEYKNIAERAMPNILVEDNCESIGGRGEMTITHIKPSIKKKIKSVVVKEFEGIDHLPDDLDNL